MKRRNLWALLNASKGLINSIFMAPYAVEVEIVLLYYHLKTCTDVISPYDFLKNQSFTTRGCISL